MHNIRIKKRNGELELLDIPSIQKKTFKATEGIDGVSQSELEVSLQFKFVDGMLSSDIQSHITTTAVDMIDIDKPNYTFVAARSFLFDLYHRVGAMFNGTKGNPYSHSLKKYLEYGASINKINNSFFKKFNLDELNNYIKPERDYLFSYLGVKTLHDRYLLKTPLGETFELPQHMFMAIAMFLAQEESSENCNQMAKEFYDVISSFEVMLATPTLSNARTNRNQLSSCFQGVAPDNIEGIYDSYKDQALLSKFGGGIGWDWANIRASNSVIDDNIGAAGGLVPWMKIENDTALAVDQLGCVAENTYVEVIDTIETNTGNIHDFRKEYIKIDLNNKEKIEEIAGFASNFAFEYGKYSKNFISSLLYDYIINDKNLEFLCNIYNLDRDTYKKIIGKYKKINKGLPLGFKILKKYDNYAISKDGIVINLDSLKPLKTIVDRKGYVRISINKKSITLHKLLVKEFVQENLKGLTIDHKDDNKLNNSIDNFNIISNEDNVSKSWLNKSSLRIEKIKIKGHISYGKELNNSKTEKENYIAIEKINTKKILIGELRVGDLVKSYNVSLNKIEYKEVLSTYDIIVKKKDQIKLTYKDGSYIVTSKWHPTYVKKDSNEFEYIRADEVSVGDFGLNSLKKAVEIVSIDLNPEYSESYKDLTVKGNNNYFASTDLKDSEMYLIHNTRKGAIAVYIEPWHMDIEDYLDLKQNSGEDRRRAHDIFPALWLNDLFMERVLKNEDWTLFDPYEVPELHNTDNVEFVKLYEEAESNDNIRKKVIKAKDLWKKVLTRYFETGSPFLAFKDTANNRNQNNHVGQIKASNLCTEIFQNTKENKYVISVKTASGVYKFEENEDVKVVLLDGEISHKKARKVSNVDLIQTDKGIEKILFVKKEIGEKGETLVCNLASVNLSKINTKEDFERVIPVAVRMLDNVININFYPIEQAFLHNINYRSIGLGVMGEAELLAVNSIEWGSQEHFNYIDKIMEMFSYNTIKASSNLAKEKGSYPYYEGSKWSKGILPIDTCNKNASELTNLENVYNWEELKEMVKKDGIRNGYLMAVAPTSSISILVGTTQAIEPVYKRKWFEENLSGLIPVVVPKLSPDTWAFYKPAFEIDQLNVVKAAAIRQKWMDQGQSTNIFMDLNKASLKYLHEIYTLAWKLGLKSTYYLRSQSADSNKAITKIENTDVNNGSNTQEPQNPDVIDRKMECSGCQ